jgi:cell division protein FtsB
MRDIGQRIQRYRLSRYAPPRDPVRRRLRLVWVIAAIWVVWVGFLSDHSFYRLWRLERQNSQARRELERVRHETMLRDAEVNDPEASRLRAEHWLREQGGMAGRGEIVYRIRDARGDSLSR